MLRSPSSIRSLLHLSGRRLCPRSPRFLGSPNPPLPCSARSPPAPASSLPPPCPPTAAPGGPPTTTTRSSTVSAPPPPTPPRTPTSGLSSTPSRAASSFRALRRHPAPRKRRRSRGRGQASARARRRRARRKRERVRERGRACASGEKSQTRPSPVSAARKPAGKGSKENVTCVCIYCWEGHSQWWGACRHCKAPGPILEIREMVPQCDGGSSEEGMEEGGGEGERDDEEKAGVKEQGKGKRKGRACSSSEKGQTSQSSVAAAWKPAGKGGKERVLYVCINCREGHLQWWGTCRYYNASRTIQKIREMVPQCDGGPSEKEVEEGEGAGERDDEEKAGVKEEEKNGEGKGKWKRKGRASAAGKKGQSSPPLVAVAQKSVGKGGKVRAWYVCSHCGEGYPRWWGCCRHCHAVGTLEKSREMVPPSFQEVD